VCVAGPRRNAAAVHIHNFVTRDGTPPEDFRRTAREQLERYPTIEVRAVRVEAITGERGAFTVRLATHAVEAKRVLLCTGLVDQLLPIEGYAALWGRSIFQCPYCHGWEIKDRRWGVLAGATEPQHLLPFALQALSWSGEVTVFTNGLDFPPEVEARLTSAGIRVEPVRIERLVAKDEHLVAIELATGARVACDALFSHPPQQQVEVVRALGLTLDEHGYVQVDPMKSETSIPGIYAAGDLTTRLQAAIIAAGAGMKAAAMINVDLALG
jgi:thioredoxin reductase